jgi:hypothetical protein
MVLIFIELLLKFNVGNYNKGILEKNRLEITRTYLKG